MGTRNDCVCCCKVQVCEKHEVTVISVTAVLRVRIVQGAIQLISFILQIKTANGTLKLYTLRFTIFHRNYFFFMVMFFNFAFMVYEAGPSH